MKREGGSPQPEASPRRDGRRPLTSPRPSSPRPLTSPRPSSPGVMAQGPVWTVKAAVPLQLGDGKCEAVSSGVSVIDVSFSSPMNVKEISFRNFYTAFLTIRIQQKNPGKTTPRRKEAWRTCVRDHRLMPNPHTEEGSQDYGTLCRSQMLCDTDNVSAMRLILRQPSPVWTTFTLEEIQINPPSRQSPQKGASWWLNHLPAKEQRRGVSKALPDPERVAAELQQMWALTEVMRANQNAASVGRFDVDGCYDISLLSYT